MKLLFLGVSNAFAVGENNFQSNMLLESTSGKKLLIDCGSDVRHSLHACNYSFKDIDAVYISHLHADHIGGLEWLGFCKFFSDEPKPALYISEDQRQPLWDNSLSGGMTCLETEKSTLDTYFSVKPLINQSFIWEDYHFQLVRTQHSIDHFCHKPSYGLFISGGKQAVFITTDARFNSNGFKEMYQKADIIFQDCELLSKASNQHAQYEQLKSLNPQIKSKMWLYDYHEGPLPNAQKDNFRGFVTRGQTFEF